MIDRETFALWMGILSDKYNRELTVPTQRVFYELCSAELTTEQFVVGAKRALRNNAFWPSPKEIIEYATPQQDPALEAGEIFEDLLRWTARPNAMLTIRDRSDEVAMRAFLAVGGVEKFRRLTHDAVPFLRREFVAAYVAAKQDAREIAQVERALGSSITPAIADRPSLRLHKGPESAGALLDEVMQSIAPADDERLQVIRESFPLCTKCGTPLGDEPIVLVRNHTRAVHARCTGTAAA